MSRDEVRAELDNMAIAAVDSRTTVTRFICGRVVNCYRSKRNALLFSVDGINIARCFLHDYIAANAKAAGGAK